MARAWYYVELVGDHGTFFEYTYYHLAPAFFLAGADSSGEAKLRTRAQGNIQS